MAEAEEVLIEAARRAGSAAWALWRRRAARATAPPRPLLADCRMQLAMLIEAVLGVAPDIRAAQAPAPASRLGRRLRVGTWQAPDAGLLPASDGRAIYLPPALEAQAGNVDARPSRYPLFAMLQALRHVRGSARRLAACGSPLAADLFVLAEACAVDRALRALLPGWQRALDALYTRRAATLAGLRPQSAAQAEVLARYRRLLCGGAGPLAPATVDADGTLAWARGQALRLVAEDGKRRYRCCLADEVVGRLLASEAEPRAVHAPPSCAPATRRPERCVPLTRRPRVRAAHEDEDDGEPGPWMVQTSEPQEHAEDPLGLVRPQDREADGDAQGIGDSLSELESARLVSTPERARETLLGPDAPPRSTAADDRSIVHDAIEYPEWDFRAAAYHPRAARLHLVRPPAVPSSWAAAALARNRGTLCEIRRRFAALRPQRQVLKRQADGEDIDCDALLDEHAERRAGLGPAGAVYQSCRPAPRRLGLLLLIDASGSTEAWIAGGRRVIDVEKEAALVAACALDTARIEFAIQAFSGEGAGGVRAMAIKDFDAPWDEAATARLAAVEPDRFTRLGAPLRHAAAMLAGRALDLRLLLLLSDGRPNDRDHYGTRYGIEDTRQALIEARMRRIDPYCLTVDAEGSAYLPHLFGAGHYTVVQRPEQLARAFVDWLGAAARRAVR